MKTKVFKGVGYAVAGLAAVAGMMVAMTGETWAADYILVGDATELAPASGATTLTDDVVDMVIPAGANVTIDLNGHSITGSSSHAIMVEEGATLTINGAGKINSDVSGKASIYNAGTVVLNGGTVQKNEKSWYDIYNAETGNLTINGATIENTADYSDVAGASLIDNYGVVTVNSGTLSGGLNAIKNEPAGTATVNGGKLTNAANAVIINYNSLKIGGTAELEYTGDYSLGAIISVGMANGAGTYDKTEISGGVFKGQYAFVRTERNNGGAWIKISGGDFRGVKQLQHKSTLLHINNRLSKHISGGMFAQKIGGTWLTNQTTYTTYEAGEGEWTVDLKDETPTLPETIFLQKGENYSFDLGTNINKYATVGVSDAALTVNGLTVTANEVTDEAFVNVNTHDAITVLDENVPVVVYDVNDPDNDEVSLEVNAESMDVSDIDSSEVEKIASVLNENGLTLGEYYDIDVVVHYTDGATGQTAESELHELGNEIAVTLTHDLGKAESGYARVYKVVRIHDGEATLIEDVTDNGDGTVTFKSDKFSTYALAYVDTVTTETVTSEGAAAVTTAVSLNPNTLDNVASYFAVAGAAAVVMLGAIIYLMKREA